MRKPLTAELGARAHLLSRLRVNTELYDLPPTRPAALGRPRKFGARLGHPAQLAAALQGEARTYTLNLYGGVRKVTGAERLVMLKTLHCQIRVVWMFHSTQWMALVTTDLALSVAQIIEFYGARWKIEVGFREIKQEIGSAESQTRNPEAVAKHLNFCLAAATITWIYGALSEKAPPRRYATAKRTEYAFGDLRRAVAKDLGAKGLGSDCQADDKATRNPLIATVMDLVA